MTCAPDHAEPEQHNCLVVVACVSLEIARAAGYEDKQEYCLHLEEQLQQSFLNDPEKKIGRCMNARVYRRGTLAPTTSGSVLYVSFKYTPLAN